MVQIINKTNKKTGNHIVIRRFGYYVNTVPDSDRALMAWCRDNIPGCNSDCDEKVIKVSEAVVRNKITFERRPKGEKFPLVLSTF